METWSVVIPTFHRPELLAKALESCRSQLLDDGQAFEVIVIDNSLEGNAADICSTFEMTQLRYVHEPQAGLVFARNRGIESADGDFLAFLDDDEEAEPDWLRQLSLAFRKSDAEIVCGRVLPRLQSPSIDHQSYVADFYTRDVERPAFSDISDILNYVGTGNSAFRRAACFDDGPRFDERFNHFGGEDIELFRALKRKGSTFAWAPDAKVHEWISDERASFSYLHGRRRSQGQQRVDGLWRMGLGGRLRVPLFMLGGAAQATLHGLKWVGHLLLRNKVAQQIAAVEVQGGLGKVFWIGAAGQRRYGVNQSG